MHLLHYKHQAVEELLKSFQQLFLFNGVERYRTKHMEKDIIFFAKLFVRFLKENNAYIHFVIAFNAQHSGANNSTFIDFAKKVKQKNFLEFAFDWLYTEEKFNYWDNLNRKWLFYATGVLGFDDF